MGRGPFWTDAEVAVVRDNLDVDSDVLAEKLGRSRHAVNQVKLRLRRGALTGDRLEYDTRPSGWYEETVGSLLLEFPDAFTAWCHYHGYVEAHPVETHSVNWVTLRCRRDESAGTREENERHARPARSRAPADA